MALRKFLILSASEASSRRTHHAAHQPPGSAAMISMSVATSSTTGRSAASARAKAGAKSAAFSTRMPTAPISLAMRAKFDLGEGPELARLIGRVAAIGAVEAALGLVAAVVVVDDGDGVDAPAHRRLDLGDVVPEAGIAGEGHDRPVGRRAFGAEPRRKRPAQMPGAADIALAGAAQIIEPAHPHAGMAGIDDGDRVVGHEAAQFAADALGPDRPRVGV